MGFFKKLFSKEESFVPTPTQQVPGLEPLVVQAIENLFPNVEDQKQAFDYSLKYTEGKKRNTLLLLCLLSYSKGKIEKLVDLNSPLLHDMHFMVDEIQPIFPNMKAAEDWVKSTTKS